ncbi:MAG: ABC transporter permease [Chloroflexota bacterium]
MNLRLEKRQKATQIHQIAAILFAFLCALGVSGLLIASAGVDIRDALTAFGRGAFGNQRAIAETLVHTTPLILTGLATVVAFRAKVWNIGAEGQLVAGAMAATWVSLHVASLPTLLHALLVFLVAMAAGSLWGGIAGLLKARYQADEIIVTIMMNFVITYLLSYLLANQWRDPTGFYQQTAALPVQAHLPLLITPSRLHSGFAVALLAAIIVHILLTQTVLGYEIRVMGLNAVAARYKGIDVVRTMLLVMLISGGLAGLAGGIEVAGLHHRLRLDIASGLGFTGIIIALLGRLNALGVILAALFFGVLTSGIVTMQITAGVPAALVNAIQGIVLIFLLIADALARYRIVWRSFHEGHHD